jgi:2-phospho-L-lactate guanylyltransferase
VIAAVVPVKALGSAKSRLRRELGPEAVERLVLAMLGDVLDALRGVPALGRVAVVTPDADVAAAVGAEALLRPDPGLNAAVDNASAELAPNADDGVLVVLGDVAGVRPDDIERLLGAAQRPGVAIAPSNDGGTSALLRVPRDAIPAGFGPGSAKVHRELAARAGVRFREIALPSLAIDVDERADLDALRESAHVGTRTRAFLDALAASPLR